MLIFFARNRILRIFVFGNFLKYTKKECMISSSFYKQIIAICRKHTENILGYPYIDGKIKSNVLREVNICSDVYI